MTRGIARAEAPCAVDFCDRSNKPGALGYCMPHYDQQRVGKPFAPVRGTRTGKCPNPRCDTKMFGTGVFCDSCYRKMYRYGLSREEFISLSKTCESCNEPSPKMDIDHCHKTGRFRGNICHSCNTALGFAGESVSVLRAMKEYLEAGFDIRSQDYPDIEHPVDETCAAPWCSKALSRGCRVLCASCDSRKRKFKGLTRAQFCNLPNFCQIEESHAGRLCIDHDHATGAVRGVICHECNVAIGMLGDSPRKVQKLIEYIEARA